MRLILNCNAKCNHVHYICIHKLTKPSIRPCTLHALAKEFMCFQIINLPPFWPKRIANKKAPSTSRCKFVPILHFDLYKA